jgi:NitT/TauT family transport system substrate-binding protein
MQRRVFTAAAAAATFVAPAVVRGQTPTSVRFGTVANESYGLCIFAREQGFFAKNGLDVDLQYIAGASGGISAALVAGAIEAGCVSMGPVSNAHLRGIPIRLIAAGGIIMTDAPTTVLCVAKNSPVTTARDLNGKTVSTPSLRDVLHVAQVKWIDDNGGDSKTVKIIELTGPGVPVALTSGRLDAAPIGEPILTNTKDDLRQLGNIYDVFGARTMISMHVAMADWLNNNADTARRIALSLRQAAQWANANRPSTVPILARVTKIPPETIVKMRHVVYSDTLDMGLIQPQIDALAAYKFIDHRYNVADIIWAGSRG